MLILNSPSGLGITHFFTLNTHVVEINGMRYPQGLHLFGGIIIRIVINWGRSNTIFRKLVGLNYILCSIHVIVYNQKVFIQRCGPDGLCLGELLYFDVWLHHHIHLRMPFRTCCEMRPFIWSRESLTKYWLTCLLLIKEYVCILVDN